MPFIPNKSLLTWVGSWISGFGTNVQESGNQVSTQLRLLGMKVISLTWTGDSFFNVGQDAVTYTIQVQTDSGTGYKSEDDVQSIIHHAIYQATGRLPISGTITSIELNQDSGTIADVNKALPPCSSGIGGFFGSLFGSCTKPAQQKKNDDKGFSLSSLGSSTILYVGLAIFGFVGALALIGYSGALRARTV